MTLSVIMPNYNHAAWLPRALNALVQQVPAADEIVVVDDGSTDDSISIIQGFQAQHPSICLIRHERNQGVAAAIKTALAAVTGEFLLGAAADDYILPGLFACAITALRANPEAALFCSEVVMVNRDNSILGFRPATLPRKTSGYVSAADARRAIRQSDNWFVGSSVVYRRERLSEIGNFDHTLGSLTDSMANRLLAFQHGFYFEAKVLSAWRIYPESFSARSSLSAPENKRLIETAGNWIERHFPDDMRKYRQLFERRLRFNLARSRLVWRNAQTDVQEIADILNWGAFDRFFLRLASYSPYLSSKIILAWMAIRVRPYGLRAMLSYLWRSITVNRTRRRELTSLFQTTAPPDHTTVGLSASLSQ
jgi:glycosyltransferase involved in cell wall biosynthesis